VNCSALKRSCVVAGVSAVWAVPACEFGGERSLGLVEFGVGGSTTVVIGTAATTGGIAASFTSAATAGSGSLILIETSAEDECSPADVPSRCQDNEYCAVNAWCGPGSQAPGTCTERPSTCPDVTAASSRVCTCEGTFHSSPCHAALAGLSVADLSLCEPVPCSGDAACRELDLSCLTAHSEPGSWVRRSSCVDSRCVCGGEMLVF
jgi:hypothetical protein